MLPPRVAPVVVMEVTVELVVTVGAVGAAAIAIIPMPTFPVDFVSYNQRIHRVVEFKLAVN